jgi:hypothetical protein
MEEYFLIKEFEDGYDINELIYEEVSHDYCINVLDIPEHNIESIHFNEDGMELILKGTDSRRYCRRLVCTPLSNQ